MKSIIYRLVVGAWQGLRFVAAQAAALLRRCCVEPLWGIVLALQTRAVEGVIAEKIRVLRCAGHAVKVHLGCGTDYKDGWINIDVHGAKLDLAWDLRKRLPFPEGSVDRIYSEHFLEHLTVEEASTVLRGCRAALAVDGAMRISVPDLRAWVGFYLDPDWRKNCDLEKWQLSHIATRAELLNAGVRWWGHQWMYDAEELRRRLTEAGFSDIKECAFCKSDSPDLCGLESRENSVIMEARR